MSDDGTDTELVDAVVVGMGPGGEEIAGTLAEAGLVVVGVESGLVGGECPYWGCVPSKMMIRAGNLIAEARRIPGMAGSSSVTPDWKPVADRIRDEATSDWDDTIAAERFEGKGGRLVRGRGRLVATDVVDVDGRRFRAGRAVVLAAGTSPSIPPTDGLAETPYWTNHDAIETTDVPSSLIVLGGGPVGAELAQVFARFGSAVTVIEMADRLVPMEEPDTGAVLADAFESDGIAVITGTGASRVEHDGQRFTVTVDDGRTVSADRLLLATGRHADLGTLGADVLEIDQQAKALPIDDHLRVTDGVWAVGDITGKGPFTHVAVYQAQIAAADILGEPHAPADYRALPRVTFTDPEIASVGMTQQQAVDAGIDVMVGRAETSSSARGWIHGPGNRGFIHLVGDREAGILVGATAIGPTGGEVLGMLTLAVHAQMQVEQLRTMIYAYPTFHRGVEDALRGLR